MTDLSDADKAAIRENVHTINNALNVVSMQVELVRLLANDATAADKVAAAIDTVLDECQKAGGIASDISRIIKATG